MRLIHLKNPDQKPMVTEDKPRNPSDFPRRLDFDGASNPSGATLPWRKMTASVACAIASMGIVACASAAPYNPSHLGAGQVGQISEICQSVMDLRPSDPPVPVWGAATDPRLSPGENHYQGCIASLSTSLQSVNDAHTAALVDEDCRAKGFRSESPELAECVLQRINTKSAPVAQDLSARPVSDRIARESVGSFLGFTSPGETARREQLACAQLGLNPAYGAFANCVKDLQDTFYAIDNPEN
jgi:hypothetical protein